MALPLGTLNGLKSQLGSLAAMLKETPDDLSSVSLSTPEKQGTPNLFGSTAQYGIPTKQIGGTAFSGAFSDTGVPLKQSPGEMAAPWSQQQAQLPSSPSQGSTALGTLPGQPSVLDHYNQAFQQAAQATGLDANWLKAVAATERGWEGNSVAGAIGLMQIMPGGYPELEARYPNWQTDPTANILLGAAILQAKVNENGGDLSRGTMGYLGFGTSDAYGTTPDQYLSSVNQYYNQLKTSGGFAGTTGDAFGSMFGANGTVPDWGEFNVPSSNGLYGYGTAYGLNGTNHTGVDVPMPYGTAYRAPLGGTVTCGGTGVGSGADGGGCAAFSDMIGGGAGRVEVQLDNGVVLIFGHSASSAFQPGQRFNAGDVLGTSGGENSNHVHLEARVRDSSLTSGWRIVDPRSVLGGTSYGSYSPATGNGYSGYGSIAQQIQAFRKAH